MVSETLDFEAFRKKYFRFWNVEDSPADSTFDKYQKAYFHEKQFDVDVTDGQLNLEFQGENWACSRLGGRHLPGGRIRAGEEVPRVHGSEAAVLLRQLLQARASGFRPASRLEPTAEDRRRGFVLFQPDLMRDVASNDTPLKNEIVSVFAARRSRVNIEPVTLALLPLADLGGRPQLQRLEGPGGSIPAGGDRCRLRVVPHQPRDVGGISLHDQPAVDHAGRTRSSFPRA